MCIDIFPNALDQSATEAPSSSTTVSTTKKLKFQDKIPTDLKNILTTVDPDLKPNIKVAKASGKDAHKLAAKTSLAKVIKHKGEDSPGEKFKNSFWIYLT